MRALSLRLPDSIHRRIREIAKREGVSINQFISSAVAEKVSAIMAEELLGTRARRAKKGTLKRVLDKVPACAPLEGDETGRFGLMIPCFLVVLVPFVVDALNMRLAVLCERRIRFVPGPDLSTALRSAQDDSVGRGQASN